MDRFSISCEHIAYLIKIVKWDTKEYTFADDIIECGIMFNRLPIVLYEAGKEHKEAIINRDYFYCLRQATSEALANMPSDIIAKERLWEMWNYLKSLTE